jgi:hypothetical protein
MQDIPVLARNLQKKYGFMLMLIMAASCTPPQRLDPCRDLRYLELKSKAAWSSQDSLSFDSLNQKCQEATLTRSSEESGRSGTSVLLVLYGILSVVGVVGILSIFRRS